LPDPEISAGRSNDPLMADDMRVPLIAINIPELPKSDIQVNKVIDKEATEGRSRDSTLQQADNID
jgi:hypothetical protein